MKTSRPVPALPLAGLQVVEVSSFVAAPSAGLVLSQLGADVVRVDPIGGAPDIDRWPVTAAGRSLFWAGLNRGKSSVVADLRTPDGRDALQQLVTRESGSAILISNLSGKSWLDDPELRSRRADLIHVQVLGTSHGKPAVDYTVNANTGMPAATGREDDDAPVNHVLPAWDLACGLYTAVAVLGGVHRREVTGEGTFATVALEDVALSTLTTLGVLSEAMLSGKARPKFGNYLYGSFGVDVPLLDGTRIMIVALTDRQWQALTDVTGCGEVLASVASHVGADFSRNGDRFMHREVITAMIKPWFSMRTLDEATGPLDAAGVLWSPFRTFRDVVDDVMSGTASDVISAWNDEGIGDHLATAGPIRLDGRPLRPLATPHLGQDTERVIGSLNRSAASA